MGALGGLSVFALASRPHLHHHHHHPQESWGGGLEDCQPKNKRDALRLSQKLRSQDQEGA